MTSLTAPRHDVLAVTIGAGGLRARRAGRSEAADSFLDVPDAPVTPPADEELDALITTVVAATDRGGAAPDAVCWAVPADWAEVAAPALRARLAGRLPGVVCTVAADGLAAHVGALGELGGGVSVQVGADVSSFATDLREVWQTTGGRGPFLGGEGSGAWLGWQALAAGLRARDGLAGGSTALLAAGRDAFGPEEGWPHLLTEGDAPVRLTAYVPVVCEAAHSDPVARHLLAATGEHLAERFAAGLAAVPGAPLVAVGPLLYVEGVRRALASALGRRRLFLVPGLGGALEGARLIGEATAAGLGPGHRPPHLWLDGGPGAGPGGRALPPA